MLRSSLLCIFALCSALCYAADESLSGFYVVLPEQSPGSHYVDSQMFPLLGYIAARPDLPISRLKSVTVDACGERSTLHHADGAKEVEDSERQCLDILFYPAEAKALENLTTLYLDHRLLISIGGEAIVAPNIRQPVSGGAIRITLPPNSDAAGIRRKLESLVAKP